MARWIAACCVLVLLQSPPTAHAGKPGTKLKVDPAGTYLVADATDAAALPTRLRLKRVGLGPGDYIGLRRVGAFDADGGSPDFTDCCSRSMLAVFNRRAKFPRPGRYGQEEPKATRLSDIPQDFALTLKRPTIVRIPKRATNILFSPNDIFFEDNTDPNGNYGVRYTLPNSGPGSAATGRVVGIPKPTPRDSAARHLRGEDLAMLSVLPSHDEVPELVPLSRSDVGRRVGSLGIGSRPPMPSPRYRGWYPRSSCSGDVACWDVSASKWLGRGGGHTGIDLFAPKGTKLRVPIRSRLTIFTSETFGLAAAFSFSVKDTRTVYHILYAHLAETRLNSGETYKAGTIVGRAGCSGNARKGCAKELNKQGARSDHVHVELIEKPELVNPLNPFRRDPVELLGWTIATPE